MAKNEKPKFDAVIEVLDSEVISGLQYDPLKLVLDVQFKTTGKVYRYKSVTPLEYALMVASSSTGKQYNALIKGKKKCVKTRRAAFV